MTPYGGLGIYREWKKIEFPKEYVGVSKIFQTDAVKIINLTTKHV
jgi:hypothetical protein